MQIHVRVVLFLFCLFFFRKLLGYAYPPVCLCKRLARGNHYEMRSDHSDRAGLVL